jgi:hypothetical protein
MQSRTKWNLLSGCCGISFPHCFLPGIESKAIIMIHCLLARTIDIKQKSPKKVF